MLEIRLGSEYPLRGGIGPQGSDYGWRITDYTDYGLTQRRQDAKKDGMGPLRLCVIASLRHCVFAFCRSIRGLARESCRSGVVVSSAIGYTVGRRRHVPSAKRQMTSDALFSSTRLRAVQLRSGQEAVLQEVFEAAGDYFLPITGRPAPDVDSAEREIRACEATPGREAVILYTEEAEPVGAIGWWEGGPEPDVALLGMVLLVPESRGSGLAREALRSLEQWLGSRGITRLRTGVGSHDQARQSFLLASGFNPMEERTHVSMDRGRMMLSLYEKPLSLDR